MTEQSPENKKSKRKAPHPLFRLLDFAGPYKILTVVGCALSGLHSLLAVMPLVCVWFIMSQFVAVAPQWSEASGAAFYAWLAVGFAVAGVVVYFAALMCTHIAAFRTGNNMRKAATHHLSKVPLGYYDEHSTGELRRVIDGCAGQTESVLAHKFPDFVGALITPVVFVVVMFIFDWAMGLACLVPIAVSFACIWRMMGGGGSDENSSKRSIRSTHSRRPSCSTGIWPMAIRSCAKNRRSCRSWRSTRPLLCWFPPASCLRGQQGTSRRSSRTSSSTWCSAR